MACGRSPDGPSSSSTSSTPTNWTCSTPTPACTEAPAPHTFTRPHTTPGDVLTTAHEAPPTAPLPTTPTDPEGRYVYGRAVLDLTDRLNAAGTYEEAAAFTDHILDPIDGLLERLADFFDAAAEKVKEAESEDGFDLHYDFGDAAASLRSLGEDLHVATDRMRVLVPPSQAVGPAQRIAVAAVPPPTTPGRTR
ncbi:hypothetical protein ACFV1B_14825 [Streptomyces sp. NPDC059637]|uniref:hypothetical protein n=1 Tax=Streptomyces sp. NPDC059637 TaxID=3347752 RepID=UPI0036807DDD